MTENRDGGEERHIFDAVICCSGHYTYPNLPLKDFPGKHQCYVCAEKRIMQYLKTSFFCVAGIKTFEGKYFHSWDYKGPEDMFGKRVVIIGIGNSGGDIAVESSRVAEQVGTHLKNNLSG